MVAADAIQKHASLSARLRAREPPQKRRRFRGRVTNLAMVWGRPIARVVLRAPSLLAPLRSDISPAPREIWSRNRRSKNKTSFRSAPRAPPRVRGLASFRKLDHVPPFLLNSRFQRESPRVRVNQFHQLVVGRLGLRRIAAAYCLRGAMPQMIAHQPASHRAQRLLHR